MSPVSIILIIAVYFIIMFSVSYFSSRNSNNTSFFIGSRRTSWIFVALAMIGASMSGVSFISVPGMVASSHFGYLQMCIGFFCGYLFIAYVLSPLYYKLNLLSIYQYLEARYGLNTYRTGAYFFFISKILGASLRLFIVCLTLQVLVFEPLGISFIINALINVFIVLIYTFRGGVKSLIWTDILKTFTMVASIVLCMLFIYKELDMDMSTMLLSHKDLVQVFVFDNVDSPQFFFKQFLGGFFIVIAMTGLDQDIMQRTLSCKNYKEARKNLIISSLMQIVVIFLFLSLGLMLYIYAEKMGINSSGDRIFPELAINGGLPTFVGVFFIIGLMSCAYSAGGSALTSLTSSFTIDILGIKGKTDSLVSTQRKLVHIFMAVLMFISILLFRYFNSRSIIDATYMLASYTYAPILSLFLFGIISKKDIKDSYVPIILLLSPAICYMLQTNSKEWFNGYVFSYELLILNTVLCFLGLCLLIKKK